MEIQRGYLFGKPTHRSENPIRITHTPTHKLHTGTESSLQTKLHTGETAESALHTKLRRPNNTIGITHKTHT